MNDGYVHKGKPNHIREKSVRYKNYERKNNNLLKLSNLVKYPENFNDIELEIEIDGNINKSLSKSRELVDVKIVQQSKSLINTSLEINEISDFIDMVNFHNVNERKDLTSNVPKDTIIHTNNNFRKVRTPPNKRNLRDNRRHNISSDNIIDDDIDSYYRHEQEYDSDDRPIFRKHDRTQIYATQRTFEHLKEKLACQDPSHDEDKPGTPCLCQHCGMVGVLVESQKRPVIPHAPNPRYLPKLQRKPVSNPRQDRNEHIRRVIDLRSKSKSETNVTLLRDLVRKIRMLEERIAHQEEKSVPKDYFKYAMQKLLSQYSNQKSNQFKSNVQAVNMGTQYSKATIRSKFSSRQNERSPKYIYGNNIKTVASNISSTTYGTSPKHKSRNRSIKGSENVYLDIENKQGFELKSKIAALIDELRTNKKKKDLKTVDANDEIKTVQFNKTVYLSNIIDDNSIKKKKVSPRCSKVSNDQELIEILEKAQHSNLSTDSIKKLYDALINTRDQRDRTPMFTTRTRKPAPDDSLFKRNIKARKEQLLSSFFQGQEGYKPYEKSEYPESTHLQYADIPEKLLSNKNSKEKHKERSNEINTKKLNVAYVNPAVSAWNEDRFSSDADGLKPTKFSRKANKHTIQEKIEYLKVLAKKKNVDETELWKNILNQAKKHITSHDDTVSIQLPGIRKNQHDISELELTLSNLKDIVKKSERVKKVHSIELNYKTSSDTHMKTKADRYQDYQLHQKTKRRTYVSPR